MMKYLELAEIRQRCHLHACIYIYNSFCTKLNESSLHEIIFSIARRIEERERESYIYLCS